MKSDGHFYVYIIASWSRVLYIGSTNNLVRRMSEHKQKQISGFTAKYNVHRLVYYEEHVSDTDAFNRERQLKGWLRQKKIDLIEMDNPEWNDLCLEWNNDDVY